ncbi:MAG: LPS export ABC transporter periplasmic protein LptC [Sphaerochaetaceae bacterium]|nr:LPS export ABC transporter periplasmic protein LptC [Sphaerochaetaceae bacterium]
MKYKIIVLSIFIILLSSCSFLDEDEESKAAIEHPDIILEDVDYIISRDINGTINLVSNKIEIYNKRNLTIAENASFSVIDKEGKIQVEGSCDNIEIDNETYNTILSGNVKFSIIDPILNITCDNLSWDNDNRVISTTDKTVTVDSDIGLLIGSGLSLNLDTRYFEFKELIKGELYEK